MLTEAQQRTAEWLVTEMPQIAGLIAQAMQRIDGVVEIVGHEKLEVPTDFAARTDDALNTALVEVRAARTLLLQYRRDGA